jgi:hypothetical protein
MKLITHRPFFSFLSFFLTKPKLNSQIISNNFYSSKTHSAFEHQLNWCNLSTGWLHHQSN